MGSVAKPIRTRTFSRRAKRLLRGDRAPGTKHCGATGCPPSGSRDGRDSKGTLGTARNGEARRRARSLSDTQQLSTPKHAVAGRRLIGALREVQALEFARRVREVREGLGLAQAEFAQQFGLSLRSLQEWEQARRLPDTAVLAYLRVIERNPKAVQSALKPTAA